MNEENLNILEYNSYYQPYIDKTSGYDLKTGFERSFSETFKFLSSIDSAKFDYRYQPQKWTIKEIVQHLIDSERVFSYRALRIGRGDITPLAGFDQDDYIVPSNAVNRRMVDLLSEYESVRNATINLFNSFPEGALTNIGVASNSDVSVRAIGFIIIGHERHHCAIIKERYL